MPNQKRIVLLTSKDNFVWTSMQEIIPMIEKSWSELAQKENYILTIINVEESTSAQFMPELISSDLIVISCFNTKIARFIKIIRESYKIDTPFFFYLHGLATIGLWPLERFGVLSLFTSNDLFIGTCEGDLESMKISFENARTKKIPFTISDSPMTHDHLSASAPFVYIGRISPQKNLDQLITAYSDLPLSIRENHPLYLYGNEDHLGYPNIGQKENTYLEKLKKLVETLSLKDQVTFKGFVNRLDIQKELGSNYIFVSPSTHSDENFGMAAFRALLSGATCVLSDWGGHKEYKNHYPNHIYYVTALLTDVGPIIPLKQFTETLLQAVRERQQGHPGFPEAFSMETIHSILKNEMGRLPLQNESLKPKSLAQILFSQQKEFESQDDIQRCFYSFSDPAFISFFKAYAK
nr:glycosyltransferase [Bacteriovorax sp. HI3]